ILGQAVLQPDEAKFDMSLKAIENFSKGLEDLDLSTLYFELSSERIKKAQESISNWDRQKIPENLGKNYIDRIDKAFKKFTKVSTQQISQPPFVECKTPAHQQPSKENTSTPNSPLESPKKQDGLCFWLKYKMGRSGTTLNEDDKNNHKPPEVRTLFSK
ncbi:MAG: hypothetical protein WBE18_01580, partial [Gammaproteobacteria bacterium]